MTTGPLLQNDTFLRSVLDAMPLVALVVDADVRILFRNATSASLLGNDDTLILRKRGGEALNCINHFESPQGCGHAKACADCVIRNSVTNAIGGTTTMRKRTVSTVKTPAGESDIPLLITASPLEYEGQRLVLLVIQDISEIMQLQQFLPICAWCNKIRDDKNYWQSVEKYVTDHIAEIQFSHSICPDCRKKMTEEPSKPAKAAMASISRA